MYGASDDIQGELTRMGNGERGNGTELLTRRRSEPLQGHGMHPQEKLASSPKSMRVENLTMRRYPGRKAIGWSVLL